MTYTAPRTWVTGDIVSMSHMNSYVRDNIKALYNAPRATFLQTGNVAVANAGAGTVLTYNVEGYDTDSMLDTAVSTSAIYINTPGLYFFNTWWFWTANTSGRRIPRIYHFQSAFSNSKDEIGREDVSPDASAGSHASNTWGMDYCVLGDYVTTEAFQSSGVSLNAITPEFDAVWIGG